MTGTHTLFPKEAGAERICDRCGLDRPLVIRPTKGGNVNVCRHCAEILEADRKAREAKKGKPG